MHIIAGIHNFCTAIAHHLNCLVTCYEMAAPAMPCYAKTFSERFLESCPFAELMSSYSKGLKTKTKTNSNMLFVFLAVCYTVPNHTFCLLLLLIPNRKFPRIKIPICCHLSLFQKIPENPKSWCHTKRRMDG